MQEAYAMAIHLLLRALFGKVWAHYGPGKRLSQGRFTVCGNCPELILGIEETKPAGHLGGKVVNQARTTLNRLTRSTRALRHPKRPGAHFFTLGLTFLICLRQVLRP